MERRKFIKNTLLTSAGIIAVPYINKVYGENLIPDDLAKNFLNPPDNARPWCFYMWMNGNITREGITLDLEAMQRMGIGGFINFNSAVGIVRGPVDYAGSAWTEAVAYTAAEATRLGLDMFLHNSPGYSGCGGPWVTPEMSMQQLVWTETQASSITGNITVQLPKPYAKRGYYRDAFAIAYPALAVEKGLMKDKLIAAAVNGKPINKVIITDGNPETKIRLNVDGNTKSTLILQFAEPFDARAISILRKPEIPRDLFDGPRDHPPVFLLEASADGENYKQIGRINCVELREMDTPSTLSFEAVSAKYYRLTTTTSTWLSEVELFSGPRLGGWPGKTSYTHGSLGGSTPAIENDLIIDPSYVINISAYVDQAGNLNWNAPAGRWTILRIGHTTTGEEPAAHPDAGKGLETDKYNKAALDQHFEHFLDPLLQKLTPSIGKGMKGITVDSWEAGKSNWTIEFPTEFKKSKGYDIMPWLAAMTGRIIGGVEATERFLWDVRKTQAELLANNFYGYFQQCCHQRGLQFNAEPYGDGVFDSLQVGQHLDTPMSEFWTRYIYGSDVTSKQAASIAHVYGRKVAAAEAFTSMPLNSKWADYPYSLKAEGDYFFTLGINRLVFHTFVHQPYTTGKPGMTMGPFGSHFDRNNTWTEQAYGWTNYLKRTQYLLQQGLFVADACYFKGDEPTSGVPDTYDFMPAGHIADVIGAEGLNRFSVKSNQIVLPDGMSYRICIMAKLDSLLPATVYKLKKLVNEGMILVVSNRPGKTYGHQKDDQYIKKEIAELYGQLDGIRVKESAFGKGKVIWADNVVDVFTNLQIQPDFSYTAENPDAAIHYIHKKQGNTDVYFVSNNRRRYEKLVCTFRIADMQPEIWNSETKEIYNQAIFEIKDGCTNISIELEPAASLFIVFRKKLAVSGYTAMLKNGQPYLGLAAYPSSAKGAYPDVLQNFTISLWAKPDVFAQDTRSMLFHPPEGEKLYGVGHAAIGLGAGQNGVQLYERSTGRMRVALRDEQLLQGWTHIAVVYEQGKPTLFINGKLSVSGKVSNSIVHPGLKTTAEQSQFSTYFEGDFTRPQLANGVLSALQILEIYQMGLPAPEAPIAIKLKQLTGNKLEALIYQNGKYTIKGASQQKELTVNSCKYFPLNNDWEVTFPGHPELPAKIPLPQLISLRNHHGFNISHFSGTAVYRKNITVTSNDLAAGHLMILDLGRVEVVAEIKVNGKMLANLWKAPYCTDITNTLKPGNNQLEISVTTLWANRLIGDEYLPEENAYSAHGFIEKLPDWYIHNQPKPGERAAFAVWKNFDKNSPLLESGLLGPVTLNTVIKQSISV